MLSVFPAICMSCKICQGEGNVCESAEDDGIYFECGESITTCFKTLTGQFLTSMRGNLKESPALVWET